MRRLATIVALGAAFGSSPALSAGWDTPILFSAHHMGLGGAAIAYVDDPSAMFHNPAGLVRAQGLTFIVNASLIAGTITGSPTKDNRDEESEPLVSLAPLVGVSYRITDWFAAGVAFYPVAAAGATYRYDSFENTTAVTFLEVSPGLSFKLPGDLHLGVGYRISILSLNRSFAEEGKPPLFDGQLSGTNFVGLRAGLQWDPIPELQLGVAYRHKTATDIETDDGTLLGVPTPLKTTFVLPSKLGFGIRLNLAPIAVVTDLEYTVQSQNKESVFEHEAAALTAAGFNINNVFEWEDSITLRAGVEYAIEDRWFFRGGFIYDGQATQERYPSAFGTPPSSTATVTGGVGYKSGDEWRMNFAIAHRIGTAKVRSDVVDENDPPNRECFACGYGGNYKIQLTGVYLDFVYSFDFAGDAESDAYTGGLDYEAPTPPTPAPPAPAPVPVDEPVEMTDTVEEAADTVEEAVEEAVDAVEEDVDTP